MVILDLSIVNVALPSIQSSLSFSSADLQWVVDAYAITFAGFLMLGGPCGRSARAAAGVRYGAGHVRAHLAASGGAAVNRQMLIVARGVQGFSCAFMAASSLAIITIVVPAGAAAASRDRPLGVDERRWRRRGHAVRRDHHPGAQLAVGPADQPADRRSPPPSWRDAVVADRRRRKQAPRLRPPGRADADGRADGAGLRGCPGRTARLALGHGARPDPRRARAARRLLRDRDPVCLRSAGAVQGR